MMVEVLARVWLVVVGSVITYVLARIASRETVLSLCVGLISGVLVVITCVAFAVVLQ